MSRSFFPSPLGNWGRARVLGKTIQEGGQQEGLEVLDMLAHSPATARFISRKLAQRFVADDPPADLVARMAAVFEENDGDIREVLRAMFRSPEFWSPKYYRAKLKTPLEFLISAVRASGAELSTPGPVLQALQRMGMPLYGQPVPTGYSMKAENWDGSAALLARLNFSTALANGQLGGLRFDPASLVTLGVLNNKNLPKSRGRDLAVALIEDSLLGGDVTPQTDASIRKQLQEAKDQVAGLKIATALVLGSPEFQRR